MGLGTDLLGTFLLGLATPLTAVCVLPLYPGFLAYLSKQSTGRGPQSIASLGVLVGTGVLSFMILVGVLFTTILETSLTDVVGLLSPIAFGLLAVASLVLIADVDVAAHLPTVDAPGSDHPSITAFGYGFFFGAIILPCNPGFIAVFFARSFLFTDPVSSMLNFVVFGLGIVAPLVGLAVVSDRWRTRVLGTITAHSTAINRGTGVVMLGIAVYYLVFVFDLVGVA